LLRKYGLDGEEVVVREEGTAEPCPNCGRHAIVEENLEWVVTTREEAQAALSQTRESA
jgi:hypothetical protein